MQFFSKDHNVKIIERLRHAGITWPIQELKYQEVSTLAQKTVVLTGSLVNLNRGQAQDLLINAGAKIANSISKKTDLVIVGNNPGSKFEQAEKLGIKWITEEEFFTLLES